MPANVDASESESADAGGAESSGGSGAEGPECDEDEDCADSLFCNGEERCVDGACEAGEPVECANPDPDSCSVSCVEGPGCLVEALDVDLDGFASAACPTEPAWDDCDDRNIRANPGEVEACDGFDNDCNGHADIDDGLTLGGWATRIGGLATVSVAWSPVLHGWGLIGVDAEDVDNGVYYGTMDQSGVAEIGETSLGPSYDNAAYSEPKLAWRATQFFSVFTRGNSINVQGIALSGTPAPPAGYIGMGTRTATAPLEPGWIIGAGAGADSAILLQEVTGWTIGAPQFSIDGVVELAFLGSEVLAVWRGADSVRQTRVTFEDGPLPDGGAPIKRLEFTNPESYDDIGENPRITATSPDHETPAYALVTTVPDAMHLWRLAPDGSVVCGPTEIEIGDGDDDDIELDVAIGDRGTYVLATDFSADTVELYRFDDSCELELTVNLNLDAETPTHPRLSVGDESIAATWSQGPLDQRQAYARVLDELLCK